ncbi:MAG TPA: DUF2267 domain-containing protein [Thermoleophilaceae bacterium]
MSYEYEQLVKTIQHKAEASWDEAERAAEATLTTLAERLSGGEARDIAEELPEEARRWLADGDRAQPFDVDEFLRRVAEREQTDLETAERHARAVFAALTRTLSREELSDMTAELPKNFGRLLPERDRRPPPEPMPTEAFVKHVADRAGIDEEAARRATDAVLETLAEKLAGGEVDDLAEQLADELRQPLRRVRDRKAQPMPLADFVQRVAEREGVSTKEAREHVRAVFQTLREAVTGQEWEDMTAELSNDYTPVLTAA